MNDMWREYKYTCPDCWSFVEIVTTKPILREECLTCNSTLTIYSIQDEHTMSDTPENKEETQMETMKESYTQELELKYGNEITELKNQLSNHTNCDYWKSENGRIGSQLIELVNESYENESDSEEILRAICEIIQYEPKKDVNWEATIIVKGRSEYKLGEDVQDLLYGIEFDVSAYGEVVVEYFNLDTIEEA